MGCVPCIWPRPTLCERAMTSDGHKVGTPRPEPNGDGAGTKEPEKQKGLVGYSANPLFSMARQEGFEPPTTWFVANVPTFHDNLRESPKTHVTS